MRPSYESADIRTKCLLVRFARGVSCKSLRTTIVVSQKTLSQHEQTDIIQCILPHDFTEPATIFQQWQNLAVNKDLAQ